MGYIGNQITTVFPTSISVDTATIKDDVTVDTSTLKVDSANNRVGILEASPQAPLHITTGANTNIMRFGADARWGFQRANSDSRYLSLSRAMNGTPSAVMVVDGDNGAVTKPLQPAFLARVSSTQINLAINTDTTVVFGTEVFDQNGDFDNSTSIFTAPVTGRYQFNVNTRMGSLDSATFFYETKIITSNFEFRDIFDPRQLNGDLGVYHSSFAIFTDMDANDTCIIKIKPHNSGTAQADINTNHCNFSGYLVC